MESPIRPAPAPAPEQDEADTTTETTSLLSSSSFSSLEQRRIREREAFESRVIVNVCLKAINFMLLVVIPVAILLLYLKLDSSLNASWFLISIPVYLLLSLWLARTALRLWSLPPSDILAFSVAQFGVRPVASHVKSMVLTISITIAVVLAGFRLENIWHLTAAVICSPVMGCLGLFVCHGIYGILRKRDDEGMFPHLQRQKKSTLRLQLAVYVFSLLTVVMGALKVDNVLQISWFLVLAWPIMVLAFWGIAALGVTFLVIGFVLSMSRGRFEEIDLILVEILGGEYNPTIIRTKALIIASSCVGVLDVMVVLLFVSLFELVGVLSGATTTIEGVFVPLLIDAALLIGLACFVEFAINPVLQATALNPDEVSATISSNSPGPLLGRIQFGKDGLPLPIKGCMTCRQPVKRIVKIDAPNVHIVEEVCKSPHSGGKDSCAVCMMSKPNAVFLDCGHGGVCEPCAQRWVYGLSFDEIKQLLKEKGTTGDMLDEFSILKTPLYLVRQSKTFFKSSFSSNITNGK